MTKYLIALNDPNGVALGYYVADDEECSLNPNEAILYSTESGAMRDAKQANKQWDLDAGYKFVVMQLDHAEVITDTE